MTPHTPGPWDISPDGVCVVRAGSEYYEYKDDDEKTHQQPYDLIALPYGTKDGDRNANARLIAAAPEMLATLQWIKDHGQHTHMCGCDHEQSDPDCAVGKSRALLARIEGKE